VEGLRIDKYLWAVRVYKTRSIATDACRNGRVKVNSQTVKPSHEVKIGEEISINLHTFTRTLKVTALLQNRVSAALAPNYMQDLTPPEEYDKQKLRHEMNQEFRPRGTGRPTKKERRMIEILKRIK
jgi:ribosome-associated heat shock protein Hsp15